MSGVKRSMQQFRQTRFLGRLLAAIDLFKSTVLTDFRCLPHWLIFLCTGKSFGLKYWYTHHLLFHFDDRHFEWLVHGIFTKREYEWQTQKQAPVIVDFGSNVGASVGFFKSLYPNARIFAYEPHPQAFALLQENIRLNHLTKVQAFQRAVVGSRTRQKRIPFYISPTSVLSTRYQDQTYPESFSYTRHLVATAPFAGIMAKAKYIDLLKIDIEGGEYELIPDILRFHHKIGEIIFELHTTTPPKKLFATLVKLSEKYHVRLEKPPWKKHYLAYLTHWERVEK